MKKLTLISLIAAAALVLAGCGVGTQDIHGGGRVALLEVQVGSGEGQPGEATVAANFFCNDRKSAVHGVLNWNDQVNGVQFQAKLPWTPVENYGEFATCEELTAGAPEMNFTLNGGEILDSAGNVIGIAGILVMGMPDDPENVCAPTGIAVEVAAETSLPWGYYVAYGCLDRGGLHFQ